VIETEGLTKRYRGIMAVDHVTMAVRPGLVTAFLGPNGAGKSTTMRMLLGLARPTAGWARIGGQAYVSLQRPLRQVGALFEDYAAHRGLSAHDHLLWQAQTNEIGRQRVREVLELVDLAGVSHRRVGDFSLGMVKRLGLAGALLGDPPILVLDEPANGLDPEGMRWLRQLLRRMAAEGRTVFVSSHLMAEMAQIADHVIVINRGRLVADATTADFLQRHASPVVRVRTQALEQFCHQVRSAGFPAVVVDGGIDVTGASAAEISRLAFANGHALDELSTRSASLEDAFLRLLGAAA
jgi:ABC-2 type transport system ATP-binding protein